MNPTRFYVSDIRGAGLCMSGARAYFSRKGWDWNDFLHSGRVLTDLVEAGDMMALVTLKFAQERSK